jgi:hypothetical protein
MKKNYQTKAPAAMIVPDLVAIAMTDLAEELREGLLALAVGTGLQVMGVLLEEALPGFQWVTQVKELSGKAGDRRDETRSRS